MSDIFDTFDTARMAETERRRKAQKRVLQLARAYRGSVKARDGDASAFRRGLFLAIDEWERMIEADPDMTGARGGT